jgi:hypothetical protein
MKVKELICQLQRFNQEADLYYVVKSNHGIKIFDTVIYDNDEGDEVSMWIKYLSSVDGKNVVRNL